MDRTPPTARETPVFHRNAELPFIQARAIADGRQVCYARHSHPWFSIGAITQGQSTYLHQHTTHQVAAGTVVWMNPGQVHACNPIDNQPWSYLMLYVDCDWLASLQQACGWNNASAFLPLAGSHCTEAALFREVQCVFAHVADATLEPLQRHERVVQGFMRILGHLGERQPDIQPARLNSRVEQAAAWIDRHFQETIRLPDICRAANLSEAYLIRAFEQHYHMTPHAWLVNRRIQHASQRLREGADLAALAQETGFADQAHFQRAFKKHLAATPGQYRD